MKLNTTTSLSSSKVLLVPYSASHVPTYHAWMQDPALQAATASEPLTLEAEYAMQRSWRFDKDKLTFIICLPLKPSSTITAPQTEVEGGKDDRPETMVGDINLFLFEPDEDEHGDDPHSAARDARGNPIVGELELMIARTDLQRKGLGRASLLVFIDYVLSSWDTIAREFNERTGELSDAGKRGWNGTGNDESSDAVPRRLAYLRVRINANNHGSVRLFESLGFRQTEARANYFNEVELRWSPDTAGLRSNEHWTSWRHLRFIEQPSFG